MVSQMASGEGWKIHFAMASNIQNYKNTRVTTTIPLTLEVGPTSRQHMAFHLPVETEFSQEILFSHPLYLALLKISIVILPNSSANIKYLLQQSQKHNTEKTFFN